MTEAEKLYLDSIFRGVSVDSAPIKDTFEKFFVAKDFKISVELSKEQLRQACKKLDCSEEKFFMGAYSLLLARFAGADEVFFAAAADKKIPVYLNLSPEQNLADYLKNLREQVDRSREIISAPYEEISEAYNFPNAPEFISTPQNIGDKNFALTVENSCNVTIHFDGGKYSDALIESFAAAYKHVVTKFLVAEKIGDVDWLSNDELKKLQAFHDTDWKVLERPAYRLLQDTAEKFPERVAAIANGKSLTYRELNAAANRLGHVLQDNGVGVEKIVGVMLNRGLEVYIARQGILKSGGAFLPMTPDYPDDRVKFIVEDSNVRHIVTTRDIYNRRKAFFDALNIFVCLVEDTQSEKISAENLNVEVPENALAYCIYTSGSTGKPKGVMLTNHNLVNFVDANPKNHEILGYTERGKVSLALAAITFDVSIMEEFIPLAHGLTICMANEDEIHNPLMLKDLCEKNSVDLMSCTPSYLANLIDFPEFESVIKNIKSVDFGAEAFPAALFTKLRAVNPNIYIMNGYGPTEATISCTMKAIESAENITIGLPNSNVKVVMTDDKNRPLPIGALGEMTILGDGIGRGYINRDDLTKKVFIRLWDKPAYKSGDLARLLPNGEIAFHGRTDNQVKLRGLRVELGEIETVMNNFAGVKASIVVVKKNSAGDYLAGYFTAERPINLDDLRKHLAASLTAYMVPGVLMQLEKFPLTANRKIDKKSLPEPEEVISEVEIIPPQNDVQQKIFDCVAQVLGTREFGITTELTSAGLTSIGAIRLNVLLSSAFNKAIQTRDIVEHDTIEKLEKFLSDAEEMQTHAAQQDYPLSRTQQDIFVEYDAAPNDTTFNLPILLPLDSSIDINRLQRAIIAAIDAHPVLKTTIFFNEQGEVRARRQDDLPAEVSIKIVEKLPAPAELVRPFKLTEEPLYRAEIFSTPDKNYLFLDFHHIVYDGSSEDIFFDDLNAAYNGKVLSRETYTGFEAALDEIKARASDKLTAAKNYYGSIFTDSDVEILPQVDFAENIGKKDSVVAFESYRTALDVDAVKNFCATNSCTFNTFFLAMFGYFLGKETRRTNAAFTTIYHGRNDSRLLQSVGMFVKTLPVLTDVAEFSSVKNYIDSVGRQLVNSMAHDIYSFAEISAAYGFKGELMCAYQGEDFNDYHIAGTASRTLPLLPSAAMSDLCLEIFLENGAFIFRFEYRPTVYKVETVKNFARECEAVAGKFLTSDALEKFDVEVHSHSKKKIAAAIDTTSPQNQNQQKIFDCVAEVIGTKNFGIRTDFYSVGLTSIGAIRLNVLLSRAFGKIIRTRDIKEHNTVEQLEKFLAGADAAQTYELQLDYPLTQTQNGIFVESVANSNSTTYNIPNLYRLGKNVDVERLQRAVKVAIDAHPYLKTTLFMNDDGDICARRHDDLDAVVDVLHVDKLPPTEEIVQPFELLNKPLYRAKIYSIREQGTGNREQVLTPTSYLLTPNYLFLDCHHIVSDGESFDILIDDINAAYDGKILAKETYTGFERALDEERYRVGENFSKAKAYYDSIFRGCDADCKLAKDFDLSSAKTSAFDFGKLNVDVAAAENFCAANKVTLNAFFNAAFGFTLAKFLYRDDAIFTTIYNGRSDSRLARSVAMLVKTLPVSCSIAGNKTVAEYVAEVGKQLFASMTNDIYSFAEISRDYGIAADVMFAYQGEDSDDVKIAGEPAEEIPLELDNAKSLFGVDIFIEGGEFCFDAEYHADYYSAATVKNFVDCLAQVAREFLTREFLSDVNITSADELERLKNIHDTDWKVLERPAYRLLQDTAEKFPERVAAIANGKSLTYAELNAAANRLGHVLQDSGVGVEKIVGVMLNRGLEVYIARQGILKSGGAFLPMTPDYPDDRVKFIVEDSNVRHIVTTRDIYNRRKEFFDALNIFICLVEDTQSEKISAENLNVDVPENALAYCIYTSGSTGKPKGVMLTNHNLVNFVDANPKNHEILGYTERGKVSLALAAITFDVSIMEEFIPLAHGLTICMANEDEIHNPLMLKDLCEKNSVDLMSCTPSYLANLIDFPEFESVVKNIKSVDLGAEAFPAALFTKLRAVNPEIYIMNGYGPTEATISCTMKAIESAENITIGLPNSNVKVVMTDDKNRPLPIGALGEMTILGDGIGRGYINRDDLTQKVFIRLWDKPAYKSGDLARLLPNGEIAFHGRTDNQVKLRGLRVELGEIETVMNNFAGVKASIVVVKKNSASDYLAGYFTAERPINLDDLRKHLAASLTAYMVPGVLMQLEKFPLTANGKVDKKSLPEPVLQVEADDKKFAATDLQQTLCEIFAKALGRKNIGADENFFEVGGTSLAASKVAMAAFLKNLPIVYADIFKYPTAEKLEAYILKQQAPIPDRVEKKIERPIISEPIEGSSFLNELFQINNALARNRVEYVNEIHHEGLGDVLLTGATGFLGIHVLYELLKNTSAKIFCFIRSNKQASAEKRLRTLFIYYFSSSMEQAFNERVTIIDGDITNVEAVNALIDYPFKTLINCAACVKHFAASDILTRINVEGVRNLINLCAEKHTRLIQISTVSVAGDNVGQKIQAGRKLSEDDFYIGQEVTSNKYVYSKFRAEELVLTAIGQGRLDGKIIRVGNLMSRISDGEFQINFSNNAFMRDIRSYSAIGKYPVSLLDEPTEFSPIDETAHMIVTLADTNAEFTVFHAVNSHRVQMGDVIHVANEYGIKIDIVSDKEFETALKLAMQDEEKNLLVSSLIAYNESDENLRDEIDHEDSFTVKALYRLNCRWSITDENYIKNAIEALDTLGFFEENARF
ncbi:MAG: amino acid adenylation domain-containing protein [Selenomonadaceae bacterium]|nr:amino acid adenylation domain-containing protein [Selenomonadaceae bacterium]